jgi:hypothetical protein
MDTKMAPAFYSQLRCIYTVNRTNSLILSTVVAYHVVCPPRSNSATMGVWSLGRSDARGTLSI